MNRITIKMPLINECTVSQCTYNKNGCCHARAITIGDSKRPGCDSFWKGARHTSRDKQIAGIGACRVESCKFNDDLECMAESVHVGMIKAGSACLTYRQ